MSASVVVAISVDPQPSSRNEEVAAVAAVDVVAAGTALDHYLVVDNQRLALVFVAASVVVVAAMVVVVADTQAACLAQSHIHQR